MQETQVWSLGQEDPLEKEMAIHSSILAWEIWWTEEPGGLHSMGSQQVRHNWVTELKRRDRRHGFDPWVRKISWKRKGQCTPVFLPGKSDGQRSLVGYRPWGSQSPSQRSNWACMQNEWYITVLQIWVCFLSKFNKHLNKHLIFKVKFYFKIIWTVILKIIESH